MVRGANFNQWPDELMATLSINNDTPEMYKDVTSVDSLQLVEKSPTEMIFQKDSISAGTIRGNNFYLGSIISQDRHTIYWTNNTRPLP